MASSNTFLVCNVGCKSLLILAGKHQFEKEEEEEEVAILQSRDVFRFL